MLAWPYAGVMIQALQVMGLAALQAVVSHALTVGRLVRRKSTVADMSDELDEATRWPSAEQVRQGGRRQSEMTLREQIKEVEEATGQIKEVSGGDVVNNRENLSMKDKIQLMIREQAVAEAEASGNKEALKVT